MLDYNKRLVEVDVILQYLAVEDYNKIPIEVIKNIKENKDKKYNWKYDETKTLSEQNISRDTIIILSYLNMKYLLNKEQKEVLEQIHKVNEQKAEDEKRKVYNPDNIFENKQNILREKNATSLILYEKKSIFRKVLDFITKILSKD